MADCRRVDDLGRVVIPKGVRTILGIEVGDDLDIQIAGDMVCYRKHKSADVVEVVRCEDCEYWDTTWNPKAAKDGEHYCPATDLFTTPDWFCADGERRSNDG